MKYYIFSIITHLYVELLRRTNYLNQESYEVLKSPQYFLSLLDFQGLLKYVKFKPVLFIKGYLTFFSIHAPAPPLKLLVNSLLQLLIKTFFFNDIFHDFEKLPLVNDLYFNHTNLMIRSLFQETVTLDHSYDLLNIFFLAFSVFFFCRKIRFKQKSLKRQL